jgi:Protein of unknown function (DUF3099)
VKAPHHTRREQVQLVTQAQPSKSADIRYRERRYLLMMGIRVLCFVAAVVLFVNHGGWLTAIPAVGAIAIPYFAVVLANGGREPNGGRGFREYTPNLPVRAGPGAAGAGQERPVQPGESGTAGSNGAPGENGTSGHENPR